jgi:hypothetical protein
MGTHLDVLAQPGEELQILIGVLYYTSPGAWIVPASALLEDSSVQDVASAQVHMGSASKPVGPELFINTGDLNGDGFSDVLVGDEVGAVVLLGPHSGMVSTEDGDAILGRGERPLNARAFGDLDGDGLDEVGIGFRDTYDVGPSVLAIYSGFSGGTQTLSEADMRFSHARAASSASCVWDGGDKLILIGGEDGAWIVRPQLGYVELGEPIVEAPFGGATAEVLGDCMGEQNEFLVGANNSRDRAGEVWLLEL